MTGRVFDWMSGDRFVRTSTAAWEIGCGSVSFDVAMSHWAVVESVTSMLSQPPIRAALIARYFEGPPATPSRWVARRSCCRVAPMTRSSMSRFNGSPSSAMYRRFSSPTAPCFLARAIRGEVKKLSPARSGATIPGAPIRSSRSPCGPACSMRPGHACCVPALFA